jgi:hypothetical protein
MVATVGCLTAIVLFGGSIPAAMADDRHGQHNRLDIEVVSSPRADVVTGGQALVRITGAGSGVTVTVGRRDVTGAFTAMPDGSLLGVVGGLPNGSSTIVARARHRGTESVRVVNYPITGPVFSGPQQQPFFCETQVFGLAPASPPNCAAPSVVSYVYRTTAGQYAPLADPASRPDNLAQATVDGRSVPYIVRVERGTIDRAVYEIAALYDGQNPSPVRPNGSWNGRLVYTFGGGCNVGYHQGASTGGVLNDLFLGSGYAVASSTLNVLDNNCSTIISAEVAMMVKEHFIESYGPVRHTIGWGGSGGAIQQYGIAENYPGILDGIIPQISFPDATTVSPTVGDCRLLNRYFSGAGAGYTPVQQAAISGFRTWGSCLNWDLAFASRGNALEACPPAIPVAALYHPDTNPDGIKCTSAEQMVNVLGRDPSTGFARSWVDNIGVQYGLAALTAGQITPAQFVHLNENVGGYDHVGRTVAQRTEADTLALIRVYRSGLAISGAGGLASTPIIDLRNYTDAVNDIHTRFWSFTARQRLIDANGSAANQVILTAGLTTGTANPNAYALSAMDRWLTAIGADNGRGSGQAGSLDASRPRSARFGDRSKVLRNRPADLADACWTPTGQLVVEPATWQGAGTCNTLYPSFGDTRIAAGAPLRDDVLKCRLRPLNFADYPVAFTAEEQARLRAVFPGGVCDFRRKGVGQFPLAGVWQRYGR